MRNIVSLVVFLALACHHPKAKETRKTKAAQPTTQTASNPPTPATLPRRTFVPTKERFEYRRLPEPYAMVFDGTGRGPLVSYRSGELLRWNLQTNLQDPEPPGGKSFINFSLDGSLGLVAIPPEGVEDKNIDATGATALELWDLTRTQKKLRLDLPLDPLKRGNQIPYTPGTLFASGQNGAILNIEGALFFWDFAANALRDFELEPGKLARNVRYYCISPDGKTLLTQTDNNTIYVFALPSLKASEKLYVPVLAGTKGPVVLESFDLLSSTELVLLFYDDEAKDEDGHVSIWDLKQKKLLKSWPVLAPFYASFFLLSLDKRWALFYDASRQSTLSLWDLSTGEKTRLLEWGSYLAAFSFDSRSLAVLDQRSGGFYLWSLSDLKAPTLGFAQQGHSDEVTALSLLAPNKLLSGSINGELKLWNLDKNELEKNLGLPDDLFEIESMVSSLRGEEAVFLDRRRAWWLGLSTPMERQIHFEDPISAALSSDASVLFLANAKKISAYNRDGVELWLKEPKDSGALIPQIFGMVAAPSALLVAIGQSVYPLNPHTKTWGKPIVTHLNKIRRLALSSDQAVGASITETGSLRIFQSTTGSTVQKIETNLGARMLQFSPDRQQIAVLGETFDKDPKQITTRLSLWDIQTGQLLAELPSDTKNRLVAFTFSEQNSFWLGFQSGALQRYILQ